MTVDNLPARYGADRELVTQTYEAPQSYELMPVVSAAMLLERRKAIKQLMADVMVKDVHYGTIPGTERKDAEGNKTPNDTLYKPGAELLSNVFGLCPVFVILEADIDWTGERHGGEPFFAYTITCELWRGTWRVATASGSANSWEKKHRWRKGERMCPKCGQEAIRRSQEEWYCWKKIDGCGATFLLNDQSIVGQKVGNIPNPDIADVHNTLVKMGQKRAFVAAILIATGCSDMFTQDTEDMVDQVDRETGEVFTQPRRSTRTASASRAAPAAAPTNGAATAPAGDIWEGPGQCPRCHAPEGKRHGKPCIG